MPRLTRLRLFLILFYLFLDFLGKKFGLGLDLEQVLVVVAVVVVATTDDAADTAAASQRASRGARG